MASDERKAEFEKWFRKADQFFVGRVGFSLMDMGDAPWFDYFDSECDPGEAVELAIEDGYLEIPLDLVFPEYA